MEKQIANHSLCGWKDNIFMSQSQKKYEYVLLSEFQLTKHDKKQTQTMSTVRIMNK